MGNSVSGNVAAAEIGRRRSAAQWCMALHIVDRLVGNEASGDDWPANEIGMAKVDPGVQNGQLDTIAA